MLSDELALNPEMALAEGSTTQVSAADVQSHQFLFHGTCRRCHHLHTAVPFYLPESGSDYRRYHCDICNLVMFQIGKASPRPSLASQETSPGWQEGRRPATESYISCVDIHAAPHTAHDVAEGPLNESETRHTAHGSTGSESPLPSPTQPEQQRSPRVERSGYFRLKWRDFRNRASGRLRRFRTGRTVNTHAPGMDSSDTAWPTQTQQMRDVGTMTEDAICSPRTEISPAPLLPGSRSARMQTLQSGPASRHPSGSNIGPAASPEHRMQRLRERRHEMTLARRAIQQQRCLCSDQCQCMTADPNSIRASPPVSSEVTYPSDPSRSPHTPEGQQQDMIEHMGTGFPSPPQPRPSARSSSINLDEARPRPSRLLAAVLRSPLRQSRDRRRWSLPPALDEPTLTALLSQQQLLDPGPTTEQTAPEPASEVSSSVVINGHLTTESSTSEQSVAAAEEAGGGDSTPTGALEASSGEVAIFQ